LFIVAKLFITALLGDKERGGLRAGDEAKLQLRQTNSEIF